jgi:hypothetical protein
MNPLSELTAGEKAFVGAIAKFSAQHGIKPRDAMRLFGVITQVMCMHEAAATKADDEGYRQLAEEALRLFAHGFGATDDAELAVTLDEDKRVSH